MKLPDRDEHLIDWLNKVLLRTDILDYRYNLKGCGVWKGYGFKLRRNIMKIIRDLLEDTEIPHEEYLFPLLIPEPQFMKEAKHVKGFEEEVYWITHGGTTPLDVKLALRPTSETVMYPMFSLWIRSHQDLPLKTYQIVNCFRWEGKNTRPMLRVREITTFKEAHTVHATAEGAEDQIIEALDIYKRFFNDLGLSYIINTRPKWDTFPGADYTIAFDVLFPGRNRALQIGTVHNLGTTFAKTFDIKYENLEGDMTYGYQTCYGISERVIASVIVQHGDDQGLILPPNIAPIQVVVIPILFKKADEVKIIETCRNIKGFLDKAGIRAKLDESQQSPGAKFYHWEQKGIPLRIEVGPRDLKKNQMVTVRRDNREKQFISLDNIKETGDRIKKILNDLNDDLRKSLASNTREAISRSNDMDEAIELVENDKGVVEIPFCGSEDCASELEKRCDGLKFLGIPVRYMDFYDESENEYGELNGKSLANDELFCIICSKRTDKYWTIGRSY
ncbi:MAG: proline--tRNA ligase [Candidatus Lokiarchaeota archaeon]|nr:proline--tRNA ligase [Candidatus Lokiarchaeota archaeon]